jgi:ABC-2 type transport system ATP-binding protein
MCPMPETASPAVTARELRVRRGGNEVLPGISFSFPAGKVTGLLGPSGCGKTTLMRSIVGVQIVEGGTIEVLGMPAGSPPLRARVGYVTQAPSVYGDLTVRENLEFFARVLDAPESKVDEIIETVRLGEHADQVVAGISGGLSGGERSRVSLATALLNDPELLILDEPTVGLDPVLREQLWGEFHRLVERGTTLLVSSHVMDEAANCHRLLLMREGRILAEATPDELRARTGVEDLGKAFLRLIEEDEASDRRGAG